MAAHRAGKNTTSWSLDSARNRIAELEAELEQCAQSIPEHALLKETWHRFELLASLTHEAISLINRNYVYEAANQTYLDALGKPREWLLGKSVAQIWGQRIFEEKIKSRVDRCLAGEVLHFQACFEFLGKWPGWYVVSHYPYANKKGTVTHAVMVTRDITAQKQAEDALRESEAKYRALFDESSDAIFLADAETGRILEANNSALELTGRDYEEIMGMRQHDLHPREIAQACRRGFRRQVREGGIVTLETYILRKDGERVAVEIYSNILELAGHRMVPGHISRHHPAQNSPNKPWKNRTKTWRSRSRPAPKRSVGPTSSSGRR